MINLSMRQAQLYELLLRKAEPPEIEKVTGLSRQRVAVIRQQLIDLGVIKNRFDLPPGAESTEDYPWVPTPLIERVGMALPDMQLRLTYATDTQRKGDQTVPPIRLARWPMPEPYWFVQAVPCLNRNGTSGRSAAHLVPSERAVLIDNLQTHWATEFRASVREPWAETDTLRVLGKCRPGLVEDMTLVIACALGVDPVADRTTVKGTSK